MVSATLFWMASLAVDGLRVGAANGLVIACGKRTGKKNWPAPG